MYTAKFLGTGGYPRHLDDAMEILEVDKTYEVALLCIKSNTSRVYLKGIRI